MKMQRRWPILMVVASGSMIPVAGQTPTGNPTESSFKSQDLQKPQNCLPCHQRQFDELRSSVKSGYRNVSPLFNGLETAGNFLGGGLLRPVYSDSPVVLPDGTPLNTNMFTSSPLIRTRQVQAGFCYTCHNSINERNANDPSKREVPQLAGLAADFKPELFRPLRDYHLVDANGKQVIPTDPGGPAPVGAGPSLGAAGITCDMCHNVGGVDQKRSFQNDGFANMSLLFNQSIEKVGPFAFPVAVKGNFHVASSDKSKIDFLRSGAFCNGCHDVRVPNNNLTANEGSSQPGGDQVKYFRLENLSTEWQIGAYNSTNNPFGKVVRCQDCHMSQFPFGGNSTYKLGDLNITSPTPGVFATDFAAVPGVSTEGNYPLPLRKVVNHNFTGVDVPLLSIDELRSRLGADYPDVFATGSDTHGIPLSLESRREALLKAAVRVDTSLSDKTAAVGGLFTARVEAVALTGHRFPAGFSQERTTYIKLDVTDDNGFLLYQSGYLVDKPHPNTGETAPDGNIDDEDIEHLQVVVDPGRHTPTYTTGAGTNGSANLIFVSGPDNGADARIYSGIPEGLVLFRNELTRIFLPGDSLGRKDANGNPIVVQRPHFEETFNASFANSVDNYRSLPPLQPKTFDYEIQLPTQEELDEMGVKLKFPLHVHAQVDYEHFPPVFLRYLTQITGPNGPAGHSLNLVDEKRLDTFLKNIPSLASSDSVVNQQ